jgi:hypothetical protein
MPRRRPRKVDSVDDSTASDLAVVMVALFGHAGGQERTMGDPGVAMLRLWQRSSQIACRKPNSGLSGRLEFGSGAKVFPGESSPLWH